MILCFGSNRDNWKSLLRNSSVVQWVWAVYQWSSQQFKGSLHAPGAMYTCLTRGEWPVTPSHLSHTTTRATHTCKRCHRLKKNTLHFLALPTAWQLRTHRKLCSDWPLTNECFFLAEEEGLTNQSSACQSQLVYKTFKIILFSKVKIPFTCTWLLKFSSKRGTRIKSQEDIQLVFSRSRLNQFTKRHPL